MWLIFGLIVGVVAAFLPFYIGSITATAVPKYKTAIGISIFVLLTLSLAYLL